MLPNDRKGGASTHYVGPTTQALLPESSSGSQSEQPHQEGSAKPELAGRMVAWSVELLEFDIQYKPPDPIKTQFMAYFLAEFARNDKTTPD